MFETTSSNALESKPPRADRVSRWVSLGWLDVAGVSTWLVLIASIPFILAAASGDEAFKDQLLAARVATASIPETPVSSPEEIGAKRMYVASKATLVRNPKDKNGLPLFPGEEVWIGDPASGGLVEVVVKTHRGKHVDGYVRADKLTDQRPAPDPDLPQHMVAFQLLGAHWWATLDLPENVLKEMRHDCSQSLFPGLRAVDCVGFLPPIRNLQQCYAIAVQAFIGLVALRFGRDEPIRYDLRCTDWRTLIHYRPAGRTAVESYFYRGEDWHLVYRNVVYNLREYLPKRRDRPTSERVRKRP